MDFITAAQLILGGLGFLQNRRSESANRRQIAIANKQSRISTVAQRRQMIRQAQITRAETVASSVGSGSFFGSGLQGGLGSLSSQLGTNLGLSTRLSDVGNQGASRSTISPNRFRQEDNDRLLRPR